MLIWGWKRRDRGISKEPMLSQGGGGGMRKARELKVTARMTQASRVRTDNIVKSEREQGKTETACQRSSYSLTVVDLTNRQVKFSRRERCRKPMRCKNDRNKQKNLNWPSTRVRRRAGEENHTKKGPRIKADIFFRSDWGGPLTSGKRGLS